MFQSLGRDSGRSDRRSLPPPQRGWGCFNRSGAIRVALTYDDQFMVLAQALFQSLGRDSGRSDDLHSLYQPEYGWFQSLGRDSGRSDEDMAAAECLLQRFQSLGRDSGRSDESRSWQRYQRVGCFNRSGAIRVALTLPRAAMRFRRPMFQSLGRDSGRSDQSRSSITHVSE